MNIKVLFTALLTINTLVFSQDKQEDTDLPLIPSREVTISTNEGTWMALDVHPSGRKIIFDLLGDLYELPIQGGKATRITEGLAFDSQPKYAPDGNSILFLSDRSGGNNVWIIDRKEKDTLQLTKGNTSKIQSISRLVTRW